MFPAATKPAIAASERRQTYAADRTATGMDTYSITLKWFNDLHWKCPNFFADDQIRIVASCSQTTQLISRPIEVGGLQWQGVHS